MLSLEYLLEEAESNGLPILKKRGILREYLQVIILSNIYKHRYGEAMFFTGGTALRFFYNMPRFSEDLDFNTPGLAYEDFMKMLEWVKKGLLKEGIPVDISSEERGNLYVAELLFEDLMRLYKITDARGLDLMVKIEVYKPLWDMRSEHGVLSLYGYNVSSILLEKGCLFSEKLSALLNRRRGRDIYDVLFLLKKKFPFDNGVLKANNIEDPPAAVISKHLKNLSEKELKFLANQVKPFLFKEDDAGLVFNAVSYSERFLREYN
ncbi:MAG: nucleotidyl transferase AbiEii/AbiGii toxin family protein [Candidatus Omnitrophota bacterium]